jgi:hypothetical protein
MIAGTGTPCWLKAKMRATNHNVKYNDQEYFTIALSVQLCEDCPSALKPSS